MWAKSGRDSHPSHRLWGKVEYGRGGSFRGLKIINFKKAKARIRYNFGSSTIRLGAEHLQNLGVGSLIFVKKQILLGKFAGVVAETWGCISGPTTTELR